jgi:hypothetical protein
MATTSTTTSSTSTAGADEDLDFVPEWWDALHGFGGPTAVQALKYCLNVDDRGNVGRGGADEEDEHDFVQEWWEALHGFGGLWQLGWGLQDNWRLITLAKKYGDSDPDVYDHDDCCEDTLWLDKNIKKSSVPQDFPQVLLEMVNKVDDVFEEMRGKDEDYLEFLTKKYPQKFPKHLFDVVQMQYTFLKWLYAKKFPGKPVADAVVIYMENQVTLLKKKKEKLAREMQECDAALASYENHLSVNNKKRKIETQE